MTKWSILILSAIICTCGGSDSNLITVSQSHYEKGLAALSKKDLITAEKELKAAVDKNSRHVEARTALADVYLEWRRYREAENQYRAALDVDKNNDAPYIGLAKLYLDQEQLKEASGNISSALKIRSGSDEAHYILGLIYLKKNKFASAAEEFRSTLEINPGHASAQVQLKQAMSRLGTAGSQATDLGRKGTVTRAETSHLFVTELKLADFPAEINIRIRDIGGHRHQKEIQHIVNLGILKASNGKFQPEQHVTKADLAAIGQELIVLETGDTYLRDAFQNATSPFDDVRNSHPDYNAILLATSYGLLETTTDGKFHPAQEVIGAEVTGFLQKVKHLFHLR